MVSTPDFVKLPCKVCCLMGEYQLSLVHYITKLCNIPQFVAILPIDLVLLKQA